jgi:hypothetical protein
MKNLILIAFLVSSIIVNAASTSSTENISISHVNNNTKYFNQFSDGIVTFISTGDFSKIEEMFGDSGVYGSDHTPEEYNTYDIQLTSSELKDQLSNVLNDTTSNLTVIRNIHPYYTTNTFKYGTMFKFEVVYNETGRVDDFKVYVDYSGKLLTVSTHTKINVKGYIDGNIMEFVGNKHPQP